MNVIKNKLVYLLMSVLLAVLTACAPATAQIPVTGNDQTETPAAITTATPATTAAVKNPLANTNWTLISYGPRNSPIQVLAGTNPDLQFKEAGSAAGSGGCNSFGAQYDVVAGNRLSVHNIISTKMACTGQGIMNQEQQYFNALQSADRFELSGDTLTLWYSSEQNALHFSKTGNVTSTPVESISTPTLLAPTSVNQTAVVPTASSGSANAAERITFAPGATSATVTGALAASGSDQYVFHALAGQTTSINLTFSQGQAILAVWGADGNVLLTDHAEVSNFQRMLPKTQDYYIVVKGRPEGSTAYRMTISIPSANSAVKRIEFAPGSTSSTVSGQLNPGDLDRYVLHAEAGQTMTIDLSLPSGKAVLVVFGVDGNVLLSDHAEASHFQRTLPTTQDYNIDVKGSPAGVTAYSMTVTITALTSP